MARSCRLQGEHCFYHITSRGNDHKKIFAGERDYQKFLEYLKIAKQRFQFCLYGYCLMDNHYHLLLETLHPNLSQLMQYINTSYTAYYNARHKRSGHLFQGRFKSIIVEADSYFAELTRYIHLNPVRAKIVDHPGEYSWSSYNAYIDNKPGGLVDIHRINELLAMDVAEYRQFVLAGISGTANPFKNVYAGCVLGGERFISEKLGLLQAEVGSKDLAHKRAIKNIIDPQGIIIAVAHYFRQEPRQLCESSKRPMTAKKTALYLLRQKTGLTNAQIGGLFNMKLAAVSKSVLSFEREISKDKRLLKAIQQITSKVEV